MNTRKLTIAAAIGTLLIGGVTNADQHAADESAKAKCYGVAKAGKNDCATDSHSCAGAATKDNDPTDWKHMPTEACEKAGGKLEASAEKG